jgi:hypothetical protein
MKFLSRFGCGCIGIDFGDGNQLIFEKCYGDGDTPALTCDFGQRVMLNNLPGMLVPDEGQRILAEINRLMMLGRRFEMLQKTLTGRRAIVPVGIEVTK